MCAEPGRHTVAYLRFIRDKPSVYETTAWAEGGQPLTHMRCPMCTEPVGQTVAFLRLIQNEPSVQDHCMGVGCLAIVSYEVPHVYRARWTDGG